MLSNPVAEPPPEDPPPTSVWTRLWADLQTSGWAEAVLRYATHAVAIALMAGVVWAQQHWPPPSAWAGGWLSAMSAPPTATPQAVTRPLLLANLPEAQSTSVSALTRHTEPRTLIPTRGRLEVLTYTVAPGETLFGIAEKFGLRPESLLWGNYFVLKDDPHLLRPGQVLDILPVDGVYHYVTAGNSLERIAQFYGVTTQAIVDWPGNRLDPANPQLQPNSYLVVPGGKRALQAWTVPTLARTDRSGARGAASNFGQCPGGYSGANGTGRFVWPTNTRTLSGFDYTAVHQGIDIRAKLGDPVYAVDAGVVMYANWNDWGYGNLVVIDHGNGWQSVYAHLENWSVQCGESVAQGAQIGTAGSTGRSTGPHLHFELRFNGAFVNPWSVLP